MMSDSPTSPELSATSSQTQATRVGDRPLVTWPIFVILPAIWIVSFVPLMLPDMGFFGAVIKVMGPPVLGLCVLGWFALLSRARLKEKSIVVVLAILLMVILNMLSHDSLRVFGIFSCAPWGFTLFGVAYHVLRHRSPKVRGASALTGLAIPFVVCLFLRSEGLRGDMSTDYRLRWTPTQTDLISDLLKQKSTGGADWVAPETAEWGEFRGPNRNNKLFGVALDPNWSANPPKMLWKHPVGPGWGSFCVVGDRLFTQEQRGETEVVVAYHADTGEQIWVHSDQAHFYENIAGSGPRATPTFHDGKIYAMGAAGHVNCLNAVDGSVIWSRKLSDDSGAKHPQWGFSSSPLVIGNCVIVHAGGTEAADLNSETKLAPKGLVAYEQATGEIRWTAAAGEHSYSSPQRYSIDGEEGGELVLMLDNAGLSAYAPETGKIVWSHASVFEGYRVVQPLAIDGGGFLLGTTMGVGTQRVNLNGDKLESAWVTTMMKPYYNDYVEHKGFLYGFDHDLFSCVNLTDGKRAWKKGRYGNGQVLLLADGEQLLIQAESGEVVLLEANSSSHKELGRFQAIEGKTWNHPVLVKNRLYVRNGVEAACYEVKLK